MKRVVTFSLVIAALLGAGWGLIQITQPDEAQRRQARLRQLLVPNAGAGRFAFLKQEIPDIVSRITCSCCAKKLIECFDGACPVSCGPCNEQGKITYNMYAHGRSVEDIQAYMAKNHPVRSSM